MGHGRSRTVRKNYKTVRSDSGRRHVGVRPDQRVIFRQHSHVVQVDQGDQRHPHRLLCEQARPD